VKVVDLNILLYAVNRDSAQHTRARACIEGLLSGEETVAFPWVVLLGFIRLTTNSRLFPRALTAEQAVETVDSWLSQPPAVALNAGVEHWRQLKFLIAEAGTAGNLTTDAHLAALAIENGAELVSTDTDFARFRHLRYYNPLND
jgi:uncharacterized protein